MEKPGTCWIPANLLAFPALLNPMENPRHYRAGLRLAVVLIAVTAFVGIVLMMTPASAIK